VASRSEGQLLRPILSLKWVFLWLSSQFWLSCLSHFTPFSTWCSRTSSRNNSKIISAKSRTSTRLKSSSFHSMQRRSHRWQESSWQIKSIQVFTQISVTLLSWTNQLSKDFKHLKRHYRHLVIAWVTTARFYLICSRTIPALQSRDS